MGNCQRAEVSAVVIQHPGGKIERLHWPTTAEEVVKSNPGHHVALVTLFVVQAKQMDGGGDGGGGCGGHVRFTRARLLKPNDVLLVGQVYRLINSQEVRKALKARRLQKTSKTQSESFKNTRVDHSIEVGLEAAEIESGITTVDHHQEDKQERERQKSAASARLRHWRPRLQSISESVS